MMSLDKRQRFVSCFLVVVVLCGLSYFTLDKEIQLDMIVRIGVNSTFSSSLLSDAKMIKNAVDQVCRGQNWAFKDVTFASGIKHTDFFRSLESKLKINKHRSVCKSHKEVSSGRYSKINDVWINETGRYITLTITMYDVRNTRKKYGGDVILVWATARTDFDEVPERAVAGKIVDNENGTYTATIRMLWSGPAILHARIVSKFENVCRRIQAIVLYGDSVYALKYPHNIWMRFKMGNVSDNTRCSASPVIYGYNKTCNLTKQNYGLSFFCGYPDKTGLNCTSASLINYVSGYPALLDGRDIIQAPVTENLPQQVSVVFPTDTKPVFNDSLPLCRSRNPADTWTEHFPTGMGYKGGWKSLTCINSQLRDPADIRKCLSGKRILFLGDSTVRQYFEALIHFGNYNESFKQYKNFLEFISEENNLEMSWHIHEFPYHCGTRVTECIADSIKEHLTQLANDVINVTSDSNTVVLLTYNVHLQSYHPDVLRGRIRSLLLPVKLLKQKLPNSKILIKGPHPCSDSRKWFDVRFALMLREIMFQELQPVLDHVIYLDTFSIGVAYGNNSLHPTGGMLLGQIDQFLAYIC